MGNQAALTLEIASKIRRLGAQKRALESELGKKESMIDDLKEKLEASRTREEALIEKNRVLTMAKSLNGDSENNTEVRSTVNELVREIDKCIALLNK